MNSGIESDPSGSMGTLCEEGCDLLELTLHEVEGAPEVGAVFRRDVFNCSMESG